MSSWLEHIHGSAALLDLRGREQFESEQGIRLFVHMRAQIVSLPYAMNMLSPAEWWLLTMI